MTATRPQTASALLVPGDVPRLAAAASIVMLLTVPDLTGAALLLAALGGAVVPRALGSPTALDVASGSALLLAAWASQLGWYESVAGLDLVVHTVLTGLLAVLAATVVTRWSRRGRSAEPAGPRLEAVLLVTGLGAALAIVWEIAEWVGHTFVDESIGVGYSDTVSDLAAGLLGSLVAGVLATRGSGPAAARR